jgi:hypothetical protein
VKILSAVRKAHGPEQSRRAALCFIVTTKKKESDWLPVISYRFVEEKE